MKCPRCQHDNPEDTRFCGQCGRELPGAGESAYPATLAYQTPGKALDRGTTFAKRFEIIEEVGHGGMGAVYKAFDEKIREFVAIKVLKPEIASDLEIIDRFRNEIKLARKVAHRHVCRMYDLNEEGQSFYITMEFVQGEDLKSFIRRSGHLNEAKAVDLARQIAEGLAEAHRLGVIHRDLKPQNIMIDKDGNAKIMDFGIARSLHTRGVTSTGLVIGTPEYMSPEQAEARMVDHRSDIYSLGVILYEMVTGRVPFEGETPLSIALKHKTEPAPDPATVNAQVSPGFSRIILRCLEKAREDRYQSAGDLLSDLERVSRGTPVPSPVAIPEMRKPITTREITVKFRVGRLLVPGILLALVIAVVAVILSGKRSGPREKIVSQHQFTESPSRRGYVPPPPVSPGSLPAGTSPPQALPEKGPLSDTTGILNVLAPFLGADVKELEGKSAQEINAFITNLKGKLPPDSSFAKLITNIQTQIREGRRFSEAGNPEASKKSYTRGESEMRKLLALVNERERADRARGDMEAARRRSEEAVRKNGPNLLSWIAAEKQRDADASYQKDDFTGAYILYSILAGVYDLSAKGGDEEACLTALRGLVKAARVDAQAAGAPAKQGWLFSRAEDDESGAESLTKDRQYPEAAERYIMAAFLYENARTVALESAQVGGAPR